MKAQPQRMCVACRLMQDKNTLLRVVKNTQGIFVDTSFKAEGRGAYVCKGLACIQKCQKQRLFNKAFKCAVTESVYLEILEHAKQ